MTDHSGDDVGLAQKFAGPVGLQEDFPFFAYAMRPSPDLPAVCVTAHEDDYSMLCEQHLRVLEMTYAYAQLHWPNWKEMPCIVAKLEHGGQAMSFRIYDQEQAGADMHALARSVLRELHMTYEREVKGQRCLIEQYAPDGDDDIRCRYEVWVESAPQHRGTVYTLGGPDAPEIDKALTALVALAGNTALDDYERTMFMQEAREASDALTAFRAYSHAAVLSPQTAEPGQMFALGREVWERLGAHGMPDNAEWVAAAMRRFACQAGDPAAQAEALRFQGISQQRLGYWAETRNCFEQALTLLPAANDPALEARVRMSYGLVVMDLHAHWETLGRRRRKEACAELQKRLKLAEREFAAARALHGASAGEKAARNRAFIALELLRIRDLRGDHAGALAAFDALPFAAEAPFSSGMDEVDRTRYDASLLHYRFCAAMKLYEAEVDTPATDTGPATLRLFQQEIPQLVARMSALPHKGAIADRICYAAVLVAKVFVKLALVVQATQGSLESLRSELRQSVDNLDLALALRAEIDGGRVRPPSAGIEIVGLPAIDIEGLLQHALLMLAQIEPDAALVWRAFAIADEAKGRFFRRDLACSGTPLPKGASAEATQLFDRWQRALLSGEYDHRLLMADREWHLQHDLPPETAEALREATCFDLTLGLDEIAALLQETDGRRVAVLALYATEGESLAYLVTGVDRAPQVTRVIVHIAELEAAAHAVEADVAAALRGDDMAKSGGKAAWMTLLEGLLHPMVEALAGFQRLVIVPHGPWHGLPLHVALLPMLWEAGQQLGISYAPSLSGLRILRQRREALRTREQAAIALATVPAREDPLAAFEEEHKRFLDLLGQAHRPLVARFGCEATLERVLEDSHTAGLRHLLAHGVDAGAAHAMQSGLLLSDGQALPSRTGHEPSATASPMLTAMLEQAFPTRASHVTLQACSLGRVHGAFCDELWGMTRALIAGGAASVLAPMWDVDLASSSELLCGFYRRWLLDGVEPSLALAQAQREMALGSGDVSTSTSESTHATPPKALASPRFSHFAHWGAFQLLGGG